MFGQTSFSLGTYAPVYINKFRTQSKAFGARVWTKLHCTAIWISGWLAQPHAFLWSLSRSKQVTARTTTTTINRVCEMGLTGQVTSHPYLDWCLLPALSVCHAGCFSSSTIFHFILLYLQKRIHSHFPLHLEGWLFPNSCPAEPVG